MKKILGIGFILELMSTLAFATCVETVAKDPQVPGGYIKTIVCDAAETDARIEAIQNTIAEIQKRKAYNAAQEDALIAALQKELDDLNNTKK